LALVVVVVVADVQYHGNAETVLLSNDTIAVMIRAVVMRIRMDVLLLMFVCKSF